ncbi:MAG: lysylphosphatidylglycerol synthase transmembrane domain-containing protein [Candidatus Hydrothermarchaeaceae archaeon]
MPRKETFLGLLISAGLLYVVLSFIDLKSLQKIVMEFGVEYFVLFGLLYVSTFFFKAVRWRTVVRPMARISISDSEKILFASSFVNNIAPARLGELVRAFLLGKKSGIGFAAALSTVLIDRILDGLTMVALFVTVEPFAESQLGQLHQVLEIIGVFLAVSLAFILLPARRLLTLRGPLKSLPASLREVLKGLNLGGQAFLTYPSNVILLASSFTTWLLDVFFLYLITRRVGLDISVPATVVILLILNIGLLLPSAPGNVGTYEAFLIIGLLSFGSGVTEAAAVALIAHIIQYIAVAVLGAFSFKSMDLDWREIVKARH